MTPARPMRGSIVCTHSTWTNAAVRVGIGSCAASTWNSDSKLRLVAMASVPFTARDCTQLEPLAWWSIEICTLCGPGICWSGPRMNRYGCEVQDLLRNSWTVAEIPQCPHGCMRFEQA